MDLNKYERFHIDELPKEPGVYIYRDSSDQIIYVGKAINLRNRVSQYFKRDDALGPKTVQLVSQIDKVEYKTVGSEIEALILEANLIKRYLPKFNSLLKDDKSYTYISISKDKYPIITPNFKANLPANAVNYGPFPNGSAVKNLLKTIRRIFPFYTAPHGPKNCFYCHMGLCPGPEITSTEYKKNISKIKRLLSGNLQGLIKTLTREMKQYAREEKYEAAVQKRDQLLSLNYVISGWRNLNNLFESIELLEDKVSKAELELLTVLKPHIPGLINVNRIEGYDISNLGSHYFVGSMVVYQNGKIDKNEYRKFKIYMKTTQDDQFMIREVVWRRLRHPEWQFPDIIMVDGGKPQVSAASKALSDYPNQGITIIGLAKKLETIVIKTNDKWIEVNLPQNSHALRLLQSLRDEAHRFANRYRKELIKRQLR